MTTHKPFVPNAVFIPTTDGKEGTDFDRTDCTFLFVDGEFSYGDVFTEAASKSDGEPTYLQRRGYATLATGPGADPSAEHGILCKKYICMAIERRILHRACL